MSNFFNSNKIAIIGLGYVGLPLALEFGKYFNTKGFDIDPNRIKNLNKKIDTNSEVDSEIFLKSSKLSLTHDQTDLLDCNVYIITVPTPIDEEKQPDFSPLISATRTVGSQLNVGDYVIYESTVFPGATEEICVPELENSSNLKLNKDFFVGYSPERINPGDKKRSLIDIKKLTSGSNNESANFVNKLYSIIIKAGTLKVDSIKIAEASKVVENIQRDVNIALVNEFYEIFENMNISTNKVLKAASTKWNFLNFKPGLVGGHCIGVDPYYLIHKSLSSGYSPKVISSARELNESMASKVVQKFMNELIERKYDIKELTVAIFGFSYKKESSDFRNSKVIDIIKILDNLNISYRIFDNLVDKQIVKKETGIKIENKVDQNFDVGLFLVPHDHLIDFCANTKKYIFDFTNV